jgi:hypothetical protein
VVQAVKELRRRDIPVAVNTGYNREMSDIVLRKAAKGGFVPDKVTDARPRFCFDDVIFPDNSPEPYTAQDFAHRIRAAAR